MCGDANHFVFFIVKVFFRSGIYVQKLLSDSGQFMEAVNYRGKADVPEPDICVFFSLN